MSIKKAGITIFMLIIIIVIIMLTVRGCSFSKKSEEMETQNKQNEVVLEDNNKNVVVEEKTQESQKIEDEKVSEKPSNSENLVSEEGKKSDTENSAKKEEPSLEEKGSGVGVFKEKVPTLGENKVVNALVSSKKSYLVDGKFYTYTLSIVLPGNESYNIVDYFCPKKTYDAVKAGDTVKIDYQLDKSGAVSINFISK